MSRMQWFRLYSRMIDDDKLRLLAFEDRWHFVALCCLKSDGLLDEDESEIRTRRIAVKLGVQVRELDEIARRLRDVGLVDDCLNPVAWDELQYRSDNSTARVKEYRKRQQKQGGNTVKRCSNVAVTAQETEAETETEETTSNDVVCPADAGPALKPEHIVDKWNGIAPSLGKPLVRKLTPERRQLLKARIGQYELDEFVSVFGAIERSPFLRGDTGWRGCSFDWVFKKANFQKILEGNYDN